MKSSEKAFMQWLHQLGTAPPGCDAVADELPSCLNSLKKLCAADPYRFIGVCEKILDSDEFPNTYAVPLMQGMIEYLLAQVNIENFPFGPHFFSSIEKEILYFFQESLETIPVLSDQAFLKACRIRLQIFQARSVRDIRVLIDNQVAMAAHRDPEFYGPDSYGNDSSAFDEMTQESLMAISENSVRGAASGNAVLSAVGLLKGGKPLPAMLSMLLIRFANDHHSGVRISLLRWLPLLAEADSEQAWKIFNMAFLNRETVLIHAAEPFLQHQYSAAPDHVHKTLSPLKHYLAAEGERNKWGEVMTRAFLQGAVPLDKWIESLKLFRSANVRDEAFFHLDKKTQQTNIRSKAVRGIIHLLRHIVYTPEIMSRLKLMIRRLQEDRLEKAIPAADAVITTYRGMETDYDMGWFYRFIKTAAEKAPAAACQIADSMLSHMEASPAFYRVWQGEDYLTLLINMLKTDSIPADAKLLLVKAQTIQRRSG